MTSTAAHIARLILKEASGQLTMEEQSMLDHWRSSSAINEEKYESLRNPRMLSEKIRAYLETEQQAEEIELPDLRNVVGHEVKPVAHRRVHFLRTAWFRYAAILLLIAGTAIYLYTSSPLWRRSPEITQTNNTGQPQDIPPGGSKALLTLSDGSVIVLDSASIGNIAQQGGTKILKVDAGSLAYQGNDLSGQTAYNTISTPRGGQYQIVLPDGSKVWLNAASSIKFPTAFTGNERVVEMTGEAYMEIAANAKQSFVVKAGGTVIQVLGTSFNVNAYEDESSVRTTLIRGSVRLSAVGISSGRPAGSVILKPGQQADVLQGPDKKIQVQAAPDMEQTLAWKNGFFIFNDVTIQAVMRQLARWYDLEVVYEGNVDQLFHATIPRNVPISRILKALELTKSVRFKIDGRKVTVMP